MTRNEEQLTFALAALMSERGLESFIFDDSFDEKLEGLELTLEVVPNPRKTIVVVRLAKKKGAVTR